MLRLASVAPDIPISVDEITGLEEGDMPYIY